VKRLCASDTLRGTGSVRFELGLALTRYGKVPMEGFAIRAADGAVRAFRNVCPHRGQPVDLGDGQLFSKDGLLECQAHGAYFDPSSGLCVRGACPGRSLLSLPVVENEGAIWIEERYLEPPVADPE